MTEDQKIILRRKINIVRNFSYSNGCADEHPQQSYKQQKKYAELTDKAVQELYDYVLECSSTPT